MSSSSEAAAEGRFVHVYVDNTGPAAAGGATGGGRGVRPVPEVVRAAVLPLWRDPAH